MCILILKHMMRYVRYFAILWVAAAIAGCSQAPAVDVMGSLFPAWLLCIVFGTLLTAITHWVLTRRRINLLFPFLTYPCLVAVYMFTIWLIFF
jgi:hypothetical protein